ncbi:hypothetical protein QWY86_19135 [Pedobacter aquatilis]|uniref:hypothetical protein n=1 Tax=Pedobacter aquatilis TaxID=351343 RepID=UPI0025B340E8|nr:hypothetical protein [Pedobacter aquatilis]MDN3588804.1 hypothetical protein [Pedobacter aquatilis]
MSQMEIGNQDKDRSEIDAKEKLAQIALGNTTLKDGAKENQPEVSMPKTSGTGTNSPSSTPNSLIIHENKSGDDRYEEGRNDVTEKTKED